jgi:hypothetical protein
MDRRLRCRNLRGFMTASARLASEVATVTSGTAPESMSEMPWIKWLDLDTAIQPDGALVVALRRPKPEHVNHDHAINAPVAYGVAEVAGLGAAVLGILDLLSSTYAVVETAAIDYRSPAVGGVIASGRVEPTLAATARAAIERGESAQLTVDTVLSDASGRETGTCRFVIALRPKRGT